MRFGHPGWLAAGLAGCLLLVALWHYQDGRRRTALAAFAAAHLQGELMRSISIARRRLRRGLFLLALALACIALAGPQLGFRWEQVSRRGNEIVFAIDTSRSMSTPDVKPTRLARAKLAIDDFVNRLDGDAAGIVAFAGSAYLVCPITLDYGAFHETLDAIDTDTIPLGGTHIASAIREAQAALRRRPNADRILILVTDGEDLAGDALASAQAAKRDDALRIFTVGVGTASGDLIPVPTGQGGGFVKDEKGQLVKSRLDESALKAIAEATGGFYVPMGTQGEGLDTIFKRVLGPLAKHDLASRQQKIYTERYQWPLAGSLAALLGSLLIGTRRRVRRPKTIEAPARAAASILVLVIFGSTRPAHASTLGAQAAYRKGDFAAAAKAFADAVKRDPSQPALQYDLGTAAYRAGQFPQAAQAFQQAISHAAANGAKRLADQEDAYYDLGNTLYRAGQATEKTSPQATLQQWNDSVKAYDTALQLRPSDADAKFNRDLVKRKIDALKQQQDQNKDKDQNKDQKKDQNQDKDKNKDKKPDPQPAPGDRGGQSGSSQNQPPPPQNQPPPQQQPTPQPPAPSQPNQPQQPPQQPPTPQQPPQQPPTPQQPPPSQQKSAPQNQPQSGEAQDEQRAPGQMSREEARELLDSAKGDERRAPIVPSAERDGEVRLPQQPVKDW